ncbi:MAG: hypothetical protein AAF488_09020 [Planctomycetota bacterium]
MSLSGDRSFVGFGFGPIQSGLFAAEAFRSGEFSKLTIVEVSRPLIDAVRRANGEIRVNVATEHALEVEIIGPVELLDPNDTTDREQIVAAIAAADELSTALPSVQFFGGDSSSPARLIAEGLDSRSKDTPLVVYAAENNNEAAEILEREVASVSADVVDRARFLNTVIGKMSGVIHGADEMESRSLEPLAAGLDSAHLVESFRRILVSTPAPHGGEKVARGIGAFVEKDNLLPFEEAKLFGHNATHALGGFIAQEFGLNSMAELRDLPGAHDFLRAAFVEESGRALIAKYRGFDPLFTQPGFEAYVDDLVVRMLNPHLDDQVVRVARDPHRKLGWNDRLLGTTKLALGVGVEPRRFAIGIAAAARALQRETSERGNLPDLWRTSGADESGIDRVSRLVATAESSLERVLETRSLTEFA